MRFLTALVALVTNLFRPRYEEPRLSFIKHRLNLLQPPVPFRYGLHRCHSCGRATASPIQSCKHHHCIRCVQKMEQMALLDMFQRMAQKEALRRMPVNGPAN